MSLRVKFSAVLILSLTLCVCGALILIPIAERIVDGLYMQEDRVAAREAKYIENFSEYVEEEGISSDDVANVLKWTRRNRYIYLVVFEGDKASFGAIGNEMLDGSVPPSEDIVYDDLPGGDVITPTDESVKRYSVEFANGTYTVGIIDYTQSAVWWAVIIIVVASAAFTFFVIMMLYYHRQIRSIVHLSAEVESISGGSLESEIHSDKNDEIGELARSVDTMRTTIIEKMDDRQKAWKANSDLITSMSHDIRTPLTALLGYIELLDSDNENMTDEQKQYLEVCRKKTEQIKGLSDQLFLYFWAFNSSEKELELESFEASVLLEQMIGERAIPLAADGIRMNMEGFDLPDGSLLNVNVDCLSRVFDNVFDNIRKYSDKACDVSVNTRIEGERLDIFIENKTGEGASSATGTHVGLKTCKNMMNLLRGTFDTQNNGELFAVKITLPIVIPPERT